MTANTLLTLPGARPSIAHKGPGPAPARRRARTGAPLFDARTQVARTQRWCPHPWGWASSALKMMKFVSTQDGPNAGSS